MSLYLSRICIDPHSRRHASTSPVPTRCTGPS